MDERRKATTRRDGIGDGQMARQNRAECNWGSRPPVAKVSIGRIGQKEERQMLKMITAVVLLVVGRGA